MVLSQRSLRLAPWGKHECLIRQQDEPESIMMPSNCLLHIVPMMLTVHIVAGTTFFGMILGLWKQNLMSWSLTSLTSRVATEAFSTES